MTLERSGTTMRPRNTYRRSRHSWPGPAMAPGPANPSDRTHDAIKAVMTVAFLPVEAPDATTHAVGFDVMPEGEFPLNGEYPEGLLHWGNGLWANAPRWQALETRNLTFGLPRSLALRTERSATFRMLQPGVLLSLRAYNGGKSDAAIRLNCGENPPTQLLLRSNQIMTIQTHWKYRGEVITVAATNGRDTRISQLVFDFGQSATAAQDKRAA